MTEHVIVNTTQGKIVNRKNVLAQLGGISNSTLKNMIHDNVFPKGIPLYRNVIVWLQEDIDAFIRKKEEMFRPANDKTIRPDAA